VIGVGDGEGVAEGDGLGEGLGVGAGTCETAGEGGSNATMKKTESSRRQAENKTRKPPVIRVGFKVS
jgi:hypothetical protein